MRRHHADAARPSRRAFTLVELLVVLGIIALLMSLLLPALGGARARAKEVKCLSNLRQIGAGVVLYANANDGRFPLAQHSADPVGWLSTLVPYGIDVDNRLCPEDRRLGDDPGPTTSYLTNDYMQPLIAWVDYNPITNVTLAGGRSRPYLKLVDVRRATTTAYVVESDLPGDHVHLVGEATLSNLKSSVAVTRHLDERSGFLYVDGHAAAVSWADLRGRFGPLDNLFDPANSQ